MGIFKEWIQNIVVFLLITTMISHLIPDDKYKKYIRLTIGLLLILVLLLPLTRLTGLDRAFYDNFVQESLRITEADIQAEAVGIEGYRRVMIKEIETYFELESMGVNYCEIEDGNGRAIEGIRIGLTSKNRAKEPDNIHIRDIRIGQGETEEEATTMLEEEQQRWRKDLSLQFGVEETAIELEIVS